MSKSHYAVASADGLVKQGIGTYHGYIITVVTAVGAIDIRDAVAAGAGTIIDTIPSGTAAGSYKYLCDGIALSTGLFVDFGAGATGTVVALYE